MKFQEVKRNLVRNTVLYECRICKAYVEFPVHSQSRHFPTPNELRAFYGMDVEPSA